jgi:hypothetical protein
MAGKIFVNYRRDDIAGDARGVRDALAAKFGESNVFMDVDNLRPGQRFDVELPKALDACDVFIALRTDLARRGSPTFSSSTTLHGGTGEGLSAGAQHVRGPARHHGRRPAIAPDRRFAEGGSRRLRPSIAVK